MVHFRSALTRHRATTLVGCILGAGALGPQPLGAQTDPCALLKAVDVSALFGAAATPNPSGRSCNWKAASGQRSLGVLVYSAEVPGEMMYTGARGKAGKQPGETVVDESGLGDKAFSVTASFGASNFDALCRPSQRRADGRSRTGAPKRHPPRRQSQRRCHRAHEHGQRSTGR